MSKWSNINNVIQFNQIVIIIDIDIDITFNSYMEDYHKQINSSQINIIIQCDFIKTQ